MNTSNTTRKITPIHWHALPVEEVLEQLDTDATGLTEGQVSERLQRYGANRLPEPPKRSLLLRFLVQFHNILIYVLLAAALMTFLLDHTIDTIVILAVVLINAIIGFVQEGKAEKAMDAIRQMLAPQASVIRDGKRRTLRGEDLVPGDIVLLEAGDKVPADMRLLKTHSLQIQEAILTGESIAVEKAVEAVAADVPLGDRVGLAFSGTTVTGGQGRGVVVATGGSTEIGRISGLLSEVETLTTPLVQQMGVFAKWLTFFILGLAALLFLVGLAHGALTTSELFMAVVGLFVSAIPEGLPAVLTITLAVGVQAMAKRNAIVRRLPAIETLGSVSVICSDKTGTLTRNEMSVTTVVMPAERYQVTGEGYEPDGDLMLDDNKVTVDPEHGLMTLGLAAALCNDAEIRKTDAGWIAEGDPMEAALLAFAGKTGVDSARERGHWRRTDAIPFDSRDQFMATLNHDHSGHACVFIKGAPEKILSMCQRQWLDADNSTSLDTEFWRTQAEEIAANGQRVLAFALRSLSPEQTVLQRADLEGEMQFLGMVGLIDPPRPEAISAVAECHSAGIKVKMITGDHAMTALAIGRQIGLEKTDKALTGADLDQLDDAQLNAAVLETDVFARTSPEHKLRLVMALQSHGLMVAMTGDGVNDAPALKRADAGVAMGLKGSEAAKEAAEIVLADDNFASIASAVREGRTVYDNIKKVISWTLPTNAGESSTIMVALLLGMMLPITPIQILWINMITAVTLGIALAFEPTEANTMRRPPRPRNQPLLTTGLIWHIVLVGGLFFAGIFGIFKYGMFRYEGLENQVELARTLAMNTLVVMKIFHLLFIRNMYAVKLTWQAVKGTTVAWVAIIMVVFSQVLITYMPSLQMIFGTQSVSLTDGLLMLAIGIVLFIIIELEKQVRLRFGAKHLEL